MTAPMRLVQDDPAALTVLHLGCGRKGHDVPHVPEPIGHVWSLDDNVHVKPDLLCRLGRDAIPLPDDSVDVAVAHHVLEHIGKQGETAEWFQFFEELYRVLVPDGELRFESPLYDSVWCWADPTHARALSPQAFMFFAQENYRLNGSAISPYRIKCDFVPNGKFIGVKDSNPDIAAVEQFSHFRGILRAVKPLKVWWSDHG